MKREVKIGIFGVTMIIAAWAGIRFLKGFDIFSRNSVYYAAYDQINGVQAASPIMMKGVKIGTVTGISFDPQRSDNVVLQFTIKRQYHIPTDSEAKIYSNGLMGGKAIEINYGTARTYLQKGDTLRSVRERDLMDVAGSELDFFKQKVSQVTGDLSRTLTNLNHLMEANAQNISGTLSHLNAITGDMAGLLDAEKRNLKAAVDDLTEFSAMLGRNTPRVDSIVGSLNRITGELADAGFARRLTDAVDEVNGLLAKVEAGEGTIGKLMNDPALYDSLTEASANLASLLANLEQYPGRYVHFSLFGRSPEKMQEKAERKAAKAAARAERDSVKLRIKNWKGAGRNVFHHVPSGHIAISRAQNESSDGRPILNFSFLFFIPHDLPCYIRAKDRFRPAPRAGRGTLHHARRPRAARRGGLFDLCARDRTAAGARRRNAPAAGYGA